MKSLNTWTKVDRTATFVMVAVAMLSLCLMTKVGLAQTFTVIHTFQDYPDGATPFAGLTWGSDGNLYGTTRGGGTEYENGTVFKIAKDGTESVLHTFAGDDGSEPTDSLIADGSGNLYGTTIGGSGGSKVFKLSLSGEETILFTFSETGQGSVPVGSLVRDPIGNFYGTTRWGGNTQCSCGVVYKLTPSGVETVLYDFLGGDDGAVPQAGLIRDPKGHLYGTTSNGGSGDSGTVFEVDAAGHEVIIYSFMGGDDSQLPQANLIADPSGNAYGTAEGGGLFGEGTVFKITPRGKETVLYNFGKSSPDGEYPVAGLVRDSRGNLYGTTPFGGAYNRGTVFVLNEQGVEKILHTFTGGTDGSIPWGGLVLDSKGNVYGTTTQGGLLGQCLGMGYSDGCGTVFRITP